MYPKHKFALLLFAAVLPVAAQPLNIPWSAYGHDAQHSGVSSVAAQNFGHVKWHTPVDVNLQNTAGELFIHYGSPLVTAANTVIVPVRASSTTNTYRIDVFSGVDGSPKYSLPTTWTPPPHNWVPVFGPVVSARTRLWYPGPGGTVFYRDSPDSNSGASGQIAFYGNSLYTNFQAALDSAVQISTPIISDRYGDIFFGFTAGTNPLNLVSGIARIDYNGNGSYISATAASGGDASIIEVPTNCTPALSIDNFTMYFAVSRGPGSGGYLVSVDSRNLAPIAHVALKDPKLGLDAVLLDDSSAAPTVGPDGDVYYGVFENSCCANNHDRGWLLHFDKTLAHSKTPGAFGWDTTASIVTSKLVPSYHGSSTYLLFTKYNNYIEQGGDGQNKIAILDPNATEVDPVSGAITMNEVLTLLGPTPDLVTGGVKEWCINSAAVDPFTHSIIANSEDGTVYRWDLTSPGAPSQSLSLTAGVGEAYTPTVIGVDGTVYAINDAILFAVGQ